MVLLVLDAEDDLACIQYNQSENDTAKYGLGPVDL